MISIIGGMIGSMRTYMEMMNGIMEIMNTQILVMGTIWTVTAIFIGIPMAMENLILSFGRVDSARHHLMTVKAQTRILNPDPGPGPDGGTGWENEWGEGYLYVPDNNHTEDNEDLERGKKGVKKMQDDLKEGKVDFYKVADGMLTGFGVGANANGIILSASNFLSGIGSDTKALEAFGKSLGWAGIAITGTQTIIILRTEGELSTGDWLSLISAALSGCAIITIEFPILSGTLGITSGILGLISIFVSENYPSGIYEIIAPNGEKAYIYIGNNLLTA
ncbi:MAG: hypothetical protein NC308_10935 [Clostridium sp.]|nr:hypothetical protein [Bacteroides sp.]MCM1199390.1 hypothetical protein [Clostridium sp.]